MTSYFNLKLINQWKAGVTLLKHGVKDTKNHKNKG